MQTRSAMCIPSGAIPTGLFGHRAFHGRKTNHRFPQNLTGTSGWVLHLTVTMLKNWFHLTGAAGGIMVPARLVIWHVISWLLPLRYSVSVIQQQQNVA